MTSPWLETLRAVADGSVSPERALQIWRSPPKGQGLETYRPDLDRGERLGFPEVIYGEGKSPEVLRAIAAEILAVDSRLLITRGNQAQFDAVLDLSPPPRFDEVSRLIIFGMAPSKPGPSVGVLCAGTTDLGVAEEAALTAEFAGICVERHYDLGVAGLHRLLSQLNRLRDCSLLIVVAGMEGALPSVVGGLCPRPIIAVPTSVGYGASFEGLAALCGMLASCAPGVVLVNIDNGFGAGYAAVRWLQNHEDS
ncbi:MAG: nickel pincer cofactor biosynthesis protein LarB [Planctomycetota bacterium]